MKVVKKDIPIYKGQLRIVISKNFDNAFSELNVNKEGLDVNQYGSLVCDDVTKNGVFRYTIFIKKSAPQSLIAHESVHLVNCLYIKNLIKLDPYNDEPQAYLTGWFVEKINKALGNK